MLRCNRGVLLRLLSSLYCLVLDKLSSGVHVFLRVFQSGMVAVCGWVIWFPRVARMVRMNQIGINKYWLPMMWAIVVAVIYTGVAMAEVQGWWMNNKQLESAFSGRLVHGHYANGREFKERYGDDGRVDYRERGRHHLGRWSVRAGTFCTIYDNDASGGCFRVHRHSENCFEFYFVARTERQAEGPDKGKPAWTAQAWFADGEPTCREDVTV